MEIRHKNIKNVSIQKTNMTPSRPVR